MFPGAKEIQSTEKGPLNVYRYFAATLLNTAIILVGFTALSYGIFYIHDPKPSPYSVFLHRSAMHSMSADEARRFFREFDRMGERETYLYQPWLGFSERVFHSYRLNIDEGATLPTRHTVNAPAPGKPEFKVWIFGGSTVFGWGVPDDQTIASHLASILAQRMPDRNVVVVNQGHSYYYSSQEVLLFQILLRRGERCDAAVFFHGTNDILANGEQDRPAFADRMAELLAQEQQDRKSRFLRISPAFPPVRLIRAVLEKFVPPASPRSAPRFDVVNRYRFNLEVATEAGRAEHVPTVFFWQPIPPLENKARTETIARIRSSIQNPNFHYLGDLFEHDALPGIYLDHFHYGDLASARLAESIAAILMEEGWNYSYQPD